MRIRLGSPCSQTLESARYNKPTTVDSKKNNQPRVTAYYRPMLMFGSKMLKVLLKTLTDKFFESLSRARDFLSSANEKTSAAQPIARRTKDDASSETSSGKTLNTRPTCFNNNIDEDQT
ncbi:MAG: hypothetical protein WCD81_01210 [Candidatus Bathyarchaeia archaeon]